MKYTKGDLLDIERGIIAHGVNCQRTMGSGVALAVKNKYPDAYKAYMDLPSTFQKALFGTAHLVDVGAPYTLYIAHCFTQKTYGREAGVKYASVEAIQGAIVTCMEFSRRVRLPIYLPKIGCGLGGLDWETEVRPALEEIEEKYIDVIVQELTIVEL